MHSHSKDNIKGCNIVQDNISDILYSFYLLDGLLLTNIQALTVQIMLRVNLKLLVM